MKMKLIGGKNLIRRIGRWFKALVLKTIELLRVPQVQMLHPPHYFLFGIYLFSMKTAKYFSAKWCGCM